MMWMASILPKPLSEAHIIASDDYFEENIYNFGPLTNEKSVIVIKLKIGKNSWIS
jgi:hypothetical protein